MTETLLTSQQVRARYGYKDRQAFLAFVRTNGVPFIRLSPRKIAFDPAALAAWENKRRVGGVR